MKLLERIGVLPAIRLFRQALIDFTADGVMGMAAALAFHTTISLVPLLLIFINLSGLLYRESEIVPGQIVAQTKEYIGADAAQLVEDILRQNQIAHQAEGLTWSTMITGLVTGLTLFYFDEAGQIWESAACGDTCRDQVDNEISVEVCHLSEFAFFSHPERAQVFLPVVTR